MDRAKELEEKFITIRRILHENPETAFEEVETSRLIERELRSCGIDCQPGGDKTGVVGVLNGAYPGKTAAVRADIDALPVQEQTGLPFASRRDGICHACGHDLHTAAVLAAARLLSERRDRLHGTVKFIFQPAEEQLAGARTILKSGCLEQPRVEAIFGLHTWPELSAGEIGVRKGAMMAGSDRFRIRIHAAGGHGAHPHKTADPVVAAAYLVTQLQTIVSREQKPTEPAVVTVGKLAAGTAANTIPTEAVLEGTMRTVSNEARRRIRDSIRRMATLTAQSLNTSADTEFTEGCPPLIPSEELTGLVEESAARLLGGEHVRELDSPSMGSEDFACYLQTVPGTFFRVGTGDERPESRLSLHSPRLVFNEQAILTGAVTLCGATCLYTGSEFGALL